MKRPFKGPQTALYYGMGWKRLYALWPIRARLYRLKLFLTRRTK